MIYVNVIVTPQVYLNAIDFEKKYAFTQEHLYMGLKKYIKHLIYDNTNTHNLIFQLYRTVFLFFQFYVVSNSCFVLE